MSEFVITTDGKHRLWEATNAWLDAINNLKGVVERQCPVRVGDIIKEHEHDADDAPKMVVEEITYEPVGTCVCRGKTVIKGGKVGKRSVIRRINLHHLAVQESPMADPDD